MVKELSCKAAGMDCEFLIRSEQVDELFEFMQEHSNERHDYNVSEIELAETMIDI